MDNKKTTFEILQKIVFMATNTAEIIDKAVSWAVAGIGASLLFLISNVEKLKSVYSILEIKVIISLLLLSLVFGFVEKLYFVLTVKTRNMMKEVSPYIKENLDNESIDETNLREVMLIIRNELTPWIFKWHHDREHNKSKNDPNKSIKDLGISFNRQMQYALAMILVLVINISYTLYVL